MINGNIIFYTDKIAFKHNTLSPVVSTHTHLVCKLDRPLFQRIRIFENKIVSHSIYMCIDWFYIDIPAESERSIAGLWVQWAIFSPKTNSYGNLGPSFQVSLLLRVSKPLLPSWILDVESVALIDNETVFNTEKLLNTRTINGTVQYLAKWAGFPRAEATWEPSENILDNW